jgi:hypothetical protein
MLLLALELEHLVQLHTQCKVPSVRARVLSVLPAARFCIRACACLLLSLHRLPCALLGGCALVRLLAFAFALFRLFGFVSVGHLIERTQPLLVDMLALLRRAPSSRAE